MTTMETASDLVAQFDMHPTGCDLYRFASSYKAQQVYRKLDASEQETVQTAYRERMQSIAKFYKINDLDKIPLTVTAVTTDTNSDETDFITIEAIRKDTGEAVQCRTRSTSIMRYLRDRPLPVDVLFVRMQPQVMDAAQRISGFWMVVAITKLADKSPFNGSNHNG